MEPKKYIPRLLHVFGEKVKNLTIITKFSCYDQKKINYSRQPKLV